MKKPYDYAVIIGRFQPFHIGHYHIAEEALKISENIIFVIGSHDRPRDTRNPFTTAERMEIIKSTGLDGPNIHFAPQVDHTYNDERWIASIQASVNTIVFSKFRPGPTNICIIGYDKDHSSYYLRKFPQWDLINVDIKHPIDATTIRNELFSTNWSEYDDKEFVDKDHYEKVKEFVEPIWQDIFNEIEHLSIYKGSWSRSPYPPTFVTVDAVVTQAGHILLVERGALPGKGLWALPGGFVGQTETLLEAAIRELYEETKLKVPKPVLIGSISQEKTYDDPHRSARGRTISHAFHFKLTDTETGLPKIKGGDDAAKAFWVPLSEFVKSRNKMFEDHFSIVEHMVGI